MEGVNIFDFGFDVTPMKISHIPLRAVDENILDLVVTGMTNNNNSLFLWAPTIIKL